MAALNESHVVARAKRNFANNGCGNRMWNTSTENTDTFKIDQALYLTDGERGQFIEQAREELMREMIAAGPERQSF